MNKQQNMGCGSRMAREAERQQTLPNVDNAIGQPTRPTVHARHGSQNSKKEPAVKPSRTSPPTRIM